MRDNGAIDVENDSRALRLAKEALAVAKQQEKDYKRDVELKIDARTSIMVTRKDLKKFGKEALKDRFINNKKSRYNVWRGKTESTC